MSDKSILKRSKIINLFSILTTTGNVRYRFPKKLVDLSYRYGIDTYIEYIIFSNIPYMNRCSKNQKLKG